MLTGSKIYFPVDLQRSHFINISSKRKMYKTIGYSEQMGKRLRNNIYLNSFHYKKLKALANLGNFHFKLLQRKISTNK